MHCQLRCLLCSLNKPMSALRAGDLNFSFSPRNPYFLFTLGAFKNTVGLCLPKHAQSPLEGRLHLCFRTLIRQIFCTAFLYIFGKHTKIQINQKNPAHIIQNLHPKQAGQKQTYNTHRQQKSGKIVHPISSLHKTHNFVSHNLTILSSLFLQLPPRKILMYFMIMRYGRKINKLLLK